MLHSSSSARVGRRQDCRPSVPVPADRVIARLIREYREATGMTQEDAAAEARIHRAQYGRYERGDNILTVPKALQIVRALGVSPADFADEADRRLRAERH